MADAQMEARPSVDVRTVARAERHPRIFGMAAALAPGGAFLVISDHDPRPLHYQLDMAFPGQLWWDYLEEGPEVWRIEVGRKPASSEGGCCGGGH